ncbi:MAG: T9SS type A sorting domain-containing protein [Crocinitomicaceae bacterium]
MNKLLLLSIFAFSTFFTYSQSTEFWGMLSEGGEDNHGVIFKTDQNGENYQVVHSFIRNYGSFPGKRLCFDGNETVYGTTSQGGKYNGGVLFAFNLYSKEITDLYHFESTTGDHPLGGVLLINNKLYGTTNTGGASDLGVVYYFDLLSSSFQVLEEFDGSNGSRPEDGVIEFSGSIYGLTKMGGSNDLGTIYSLDTTTATLTTQFDFSSSFGAYPTGRLVLSSVQNKMFTTSREGGVNGYGTIIQFDLFSNSVQKIHDFDSLNGANPESGLILNTDGHLFGITKNGGADGIGVVYAVDTASLVFGKVQDLDSTLGLHGTGEIVYSGASNSYYALTTAGGAGYGTLISIDLADSSLSLVKDMDNTIGSVPQGQPFIFSNAIYGLCSSGAIDGYGSLFAYHLGNDSLSMEQTFSCVFGHTPYGTVLDGEDGFVYGMTFLGGKYKYGTLFKYSMSQDTLIKLHDFNIEDGAYPQGSLSLGPNGMIYGMVTQGGPAPHKGVVFSWNRTTNTFSLEAAFNNSNGRYPRGDMLYASDGYMYGMAIYGGLNDCGVIFRVDTVNHAIDVRYPFEISTGRYPHRSLLEYNGKFYGLTTQGGNTDDGVLFEYDFINGTYTVKHHFEPVTGRRPFSNLIVDQFGNLYGNTNVGGSYNYGVMFKYSLSDDTYTVLHEYDFTNGGNVQPSLTFSDNGKIYGLAFHGGSYYKGILFEYDTTSSTFTNKLNLNSTLGGIPYCRLSKVATCPVISTHFNADDCSQFTSPLGQTVSVPGNHVVTDTLLSNCGGDSLIVYSVFIGDTLDPVPNSATLSTIEAYCSIDIQQAEFPFALDNCVDTLYATSNVSFPFQDTSIHQIVWTYEDNAGNIVQQTQNISWLEMNLTVMQNANVLAVANATANSYQWMNCDSNDIIPGATSSIFIANQNGSFAVIIEQQGCVDTSECVQMNSVGLNENEIGSWKIYPNPTNGNLTIDMPASVNGMVDIQITDDLGRVVLERRESSGHSVLLNLNNIVEDGMYFLILSGDFETEVMKLILRR